ncbi:MAG: hypothetical protein AB7M05_09365 [Alphaproteobacteria bacterium]
MEKVKGGTSEEAAVVARRRFLANCGKFAIVTPPVVSLMLSASHRSYANVGSGGGGGHGHGHGHGNNGYGNGGHDGVPGRSNQEDDDR